MCVSGLAQVSQISRYWEWTHGWIYHIAFQPNGILFYTSFCVIKMIVYWFFYRESRDHNVVNNATSLLGSVLSHDRISCLKKVICSSCSVDNDYVDVHSDNDYDYNKNFFFRHNVCHTRRTCLLLHVLPSQNEWVDNWCKINIPWRYLPRRLTKSISIFPIRFVLPNIDIITWCSQLFHLWT